MGSDFVRKVAETFATRVGLILLGLATSVIIARMLGPEGRGLQATLAAVTAIGIQFGNLGLHSSNTYYVAKEPRLLPTLAGNSLFVSLGVIGILSALLYGLFTWVPSIAPLHGVLLFLALAGIPLGLAYLLLENLLLGTHQVRTYNRIELFTRILLVALLVALLLVGAVSVEAIAVVGVVVAAVSALWAYLALRKQFSGRVTISIRELTSHAGYGLKSYVAALFAYTVMRADVLMCSYMLGDTPTGYYSIAVAMADLVYMLPVVVGTIAFPRFAAVADPVERWAKARSVTKVVSLLMFAIAVVAAALAQPAIVLLYGEAFRPALDPFLWLLPGLVLLGTNTILMNYFASEGMPPIAVWSPGLAAILNIALNMVLLPRMGIVGAALSSTVAYASMLVMSLGYIAYSNGRSSRGAMS